MRAFTSIIERCPNTGLFVGYIPGFPGAHSQGETLDEVQRNLAEVIGMLLEDGVNVPARLALVEGLLAPPHARPGGLPHHAEAPR